MGKALLVVIAVVLLVYAFFDLLATPRTSARYLPKIFWFVVILVPFVGPLLWIFVGTRRIKPPLPKPRKRPPHGPDDDPDYLRGL